MKKSVAIKLLKEYADDAENRIYSDRVFHNMLNVIDEMFGRDSFAYTYLVKREPNLFGIDRWNDEKGMHDLDTKKAEAIDHVRGCADILLYKKPYKAPKKNIFSNKDNTAVLLAGLGVFFVGILVGSQLRPEVVSLLERIRNIFV